MTNESKSMIFDIELWENLESLRGRFTWPSQLDLLAASKSLITLQDIHDFDLNLV